MSSNKISIRIRSYLNRTCFTSHHRWKQRERSCRNVTSPETQEKLAQCRTATMVRSLALLFYQSIKYICSLHLHVSSSVWMCTDFSSSLHVKCGSLPAVGRGTRTEKTRVDSLNTNSSTSCIIHVTPPAQVRRLALRSTEQIKITTENVSIVASCFSLLCRLQERCWPPPSCSTCRP